MTGRQLPEEVPYALPIDSPAPVAVVVNRLRIDEHPAGQTTHVFVELAGDGLATGIRVPVLLARGARPGPVFGITAAVHGNELNGLHVIHSLFEGLDPTTLSGTVVGVVAVNVPGLHRNQRRYIDGTDLNHIFPGKEGGDVSEVYACRVWNRIVSQFDFLVDLHTASFGRINSLYIRADMTHPTAAAMAYLQRPQIILHNPAPDYTLRGTAMDRGIPAITVEIGDPQRFQQRLIRHTCAGLFRVLAHTGLVPPEPPAPAAHQPIICNSSSWMYTDRGGLLELLPRVAERVARNQLIARLRTAFGNVFREYHAPQDGVVVGQSTNPVGPTGARILHLGVEGRPEGLVDPPA